MLWQINQAPPIKNAQIGDPGPWLFPGTLALTLIGLGIVLAVQERRNFRIEQERPSNNVHENASQEESLPMLAPPQLQVRIMVLLSTIAYVLMFERLGFSVSTVIFLSVTTVSLAPKNSKTIAIALTTSLLATLFIGWLLADVVNVPLQGVFFS